MLGRRKAGGCRACCLVDESVVLLVSGSRFVCILAEFRAGIVADVQNVLRGRCVCTQRIMVVRCGWSPPEELTRRVVGSVRFNDSSYEGCRLRKREHPAKGGGMSRGGTGWFGPFAGCFPLGRGGGL